jgi:transforming growth factor-beta-induced protein
MKEDPMFTTLIAAGLIALNLNAPVALDDQKDIVDTAVAAGSFNTLVTALTEAGLVETLKGEGPFTVFAPTDAAFAALPEGTLASVLKPENSDLLTSILTYHVVAAEVMSGQVVKLNSASTLNGQRVPVSVADGIVSLGAAKVTAVDIACSNGVIHVIDRVLMPSTDDLVATAVKAGDFGTLVAAVQAAGLVETLMGTGPFTVLAPTDAAFAKLPAGTVESLLKPENREQLAKILTYHVLPGRIYAEDALRLREFATVESSPVRFSVDDERVTVAGATVVATDIEATNGVIHVIDAVIMPPAKPASVGQAVHDVNDEAISRQMTLSKPMTMAMTTSRSSCSASNNSTR